MESFSFPSPSLAPAQPLATFNARQFYNVYKKAKFLRTHQNLELILSKSFLLKQKLKEKKPGDTIVVEGFMISKNTPLILKCTGKNAVVREFEFTYYRLCGLVAAYVFENRHKIPAITSSEVNLLGLQWDSKNEMKCRLYLSSVSGSQDFYDQFFFWPLICAVRKLQLKKTTSNSVLIIGNLKNDDGETMAKCFMKNYGTVQYLWGQFPGTSGTDLQAMLDISPSHIKRVFNAD